MLSCPNCRIPGKKRKRTRLYCCPNCGLALGPLPRLRAFQHGITEEQWGAVWRSVLAAAPFPSPEAQATFIRERVEAIRA